MSGALGYADVDDLKQACQGIRVQIPGTLNQNLGSRLEG